MYIHMLEYLFARYRGVTFTVQRTFEYTRKARQNVHGQRKKQATAHALP